jgi:hypothetical protein
MSEPNEPFGRHEQGARIGPRKRKPAVHELERGNSVAAEERVVRAGCGQMGGDERDELVEKIRALAAGGELATAMARAWGPARVELIGGVYRLVWEVVYHRWTKGLERRRGHRACLVSVQTMTPECLDKFYDDVESVIDYVAANADQPIVSLEGWVASRLQMATVDGHRRRRGAIGALQRPRLPQWLAARLARDQWLSELAVLMLVWVGVPATAGAGLWPVDQWSYRRAELTRDWRGGSSAVERDIERVMQAMRTQPKWFSDYVETPLGHKVTSVASTIVDGSGRAVEPTPLSLAEPGAQRDALLLEYASQAIGVIAGRLRAGEDPRTVVVEVISAVFGQPDGLEAEQAAEEAGLGRLLADGARLDVLVDSVLQIVNDVVDG